MSEIVLRSRAADGKSLEATFLPNKGMNLCSYKKGDTEIIAQSSRADFDERFAGLGPLIGPHFHRRPDHAITPVAHQERYPFIAAVHARGSQDPFSHGIARYAPWQSEATDTTIKAVLAGDSDWNGTSIAELEGQMFTMWYSIALTPDGLNLDLSIKSEHDSVVGFHTYYNLIDGQGTVTARVQDRFRDLEGWHPMRPDWEYSDNRRLTYPLTLDADWGFQPFPDLLLGEVTLATGNYRVNLRYSCTNKENSFQLWHPLGAPFVCMEPLSAKDPRRPKLTASALKLRIQID